MSNLETLTLPILRELVGGSAAALRLRVRLQPTGGEGDKVFPPTYMDGPYATEDRRINGQDVKCVLLDSVQSQANRMEKALLEAWRAGDIKIPVIEVVFPPEVFDGQPFTVTSLDAPHRVADAILRDSTLNGVPFNKTPARKALADATSENATALYRACPTALVFGVWDSSGPRGGLGAKFARALVSEVVAFGAVPGVKPGGRLDPLGIRADVKVVKEAGDAWRLAEGGDGKEAKGAVAPSEINHSNIPPALADKNKKKNPGGFTFDYAEQIGVLSFAALRRLRFPVNGQATPAQTLAARTALAALAVAALAGQSRDGWFFRSRCDLYATGELEFEAVGTDRRFAVNADTAFVLLNAASDAATAAGIGWEQAAVRLIPGSNLQMLVKRSRENTIRKGSEEE